MPNNILLPDVLPPSKGVDMRHVNNKDGSTTYYYSYRGPNGPSTGQVTVQSDEIAEHVKAKAKLVEDCESRRSLKNLPRWEHLVDLAVAKNKGAGQPWVYNKIREALSGPVGDDFQERYEEYIEELADERSQNTVNHHKSAIRFTLNEALRKKKIEKLPIIDFEIDYEFRDRVWQSDNERNGFFSKMVEVKSHLYWTMVLLERRPIRAKSDLFKATRENLVLAGPKAPYLHFIAKKTGKKTKGKETFIPLRYRDGTIMEDLVNYFRHGIPKDCPLLFPHHIGIENVLDVNHLGTLAWEPMGNPKKHFNHLCDKSGAVDLHMHDFKHISTSAMLNDERWTIEELLKLGISFSEKILKKVYWKKNALSALPDAAPVNTPATKCSNSVEGDYHASNIYPLKSMG